MIIGLFANATKKTAKNIAIGIKEFLEEHGVTVVSSTEYCHEIGCPDISEVKGKDIDFIIPIGGDGTILRLIHKYPEIDAPFFAINMGGLGFMADIPITDIYPCLEELLEGKYEIQERVMIQGNINSGESWKP